jgi:hypothetical protein
MPSKVPGMVQKMAEELDSIFHSKTEKYARKTFPTSNPIARIAASVSKEQVNEEKTPIFANCTRAADFAVLGLLLKNSKSKNLCLMDAFWTLAEQGATVANVEPILRIDLLMDFLDAARSMEDNSSGSVGWDIAFHGTQTSNVASIVEHGFHLPSND